MESVSVTERLNKLREERIAREKERIAKVSQLNNWMITNMFACFRFNGAKEFKVYIF